MDVLDDILSSLRLSGGVVVDGEFSGDFCVSAEFTPGHFEPFFAVPDRLISYHYVRSGRLTVEVDGMAPVVLDAGSIAILPRNDPHRLASRIGAHPADPSEISRVTTEGVHRVTAGTDGPRTEVWCGFLEPAKTSEHPLLDALPALLTLDISGGEAEWLDSSMRFLAEQQPSAEVVARLAELFVNRAVREYLDRLPAGASGWLRGLADPAVSRALAIIHARYAETVVQAARAGVDWLIHASYMRPGDIGEVRDLQVPICPTMTFTANIVEHGHEVGVDPNYIDTKKRELDALADIHRRAFEAGIPLMMGSEAGFSVTPYGQWHTREIELMVDLLGMPPMAAIVAATSANARAFGWEALVGTLSPGCMADLLVLDADPLRDIRALRDGLQAVYLGGLEIEREPESSPRKRMGHERGFGVSVTTLDRQRRPPGA